MKLLYGTGNPAKLSAMKRRLEFSCDSGLYCDNVPEEIQPGMHVHTINGNCLSDEQMIEYYAGLVKQYGNLTARMIYRQRNWNRLRKNTSGSV